MYKQKRILAVVPARGGSKGIPLKNLTLLAGKSLIQHAADIIRTCGFIDHAVVSTDHTRIKDEALRFGLSVPFMRPEELSGDFIGDLPVLTHALIKSEAQFDARFDIVLMLQPTSPLRRPAQIEACVDLLIRDQLDSVWTVSRTESKSHPLKQLKMENGHLKFYEAQGAAVIARQQLPPVYHRNGIAYAFTRECLIEKNSLLTERSSAVVIDDFHVNIDSREDIRQAELYLAGQLSDDPRV